MVNNQINAEQPTLLKITFYHPFDTWKAVPVSISPLATYYVASAEQANYVVCLLQSVVY